VIAFAQRIPSDYLIHFHIKRHHLHQFQRLSGHRQYITAAVRLARLVLFAMPALIISRMPGFEIREVWFLSVGTVVLQMCINLFLLRYELRKRLRFDEPEDFIPASATAA
jgi:hypothetical protein